MNEPTAVDKAEATLKPRSRFAFLLRPWCLIPVTIFTILLAALAGYRSSRLAGIPPIDEIVDRETEGRIDIEPAQNAFTHYERAWKLIPTGFDNQALGEAVDELDAGGWDAVSPAGRKALKDGEAVLVEWERGTQLDRGVRVQPADNEPFDNVDIGKSRTNSRLAVVMSARCLDEGKTEEAWQWLRALLKFTRDLGNPGSDIDRLVGILMHSLACRHVVIWAAHEDVTSEQLEAALTELRKLYQSTISNSDSLRISYLIEMKLLATPMWVHTFSREYTFAEELPKQFTGTWLFVNDEPQLSRVLLRHVYANLLSQADLPRWQRSVASSGFLFQPTGAESPPLLDPVQLARFLKRSPLAENFTPRFVLFARRDDERARQTAIEICLCVELFRRRHGQYPTELEDLVPNFLDEIPRDLYGAGPTALMLMVRREIDASKEADDDSPLPGLIIYSRGINGLDEGGDIDHYKDIGFLIPIPLSEAKPE